jgi:hypothetical protein
MTLQNFIYLLLALVWLSGLIWASVIAFRSRKTNDKTTLKINENLNINVGKMNASKLTTTDIRKGKQ